MPDENKIDIFEALNHVDSFDLKYFKDLSAEEKKTLPPYTLMMWLSSCKSKLQVQKVNSFLNRYVFDISASEHRDLLFMLACISSDGKKKKYNWIKKKGKGKQYPITVDLLSRHYKCSSKVALSYVPLVDYEFVEQLALEYGEQDDILKKLKKELK